MTTIDEKTKLPLGFALGLVGSIIGIVWYASTLSSRQEALAATNLAQDTKIEALATQLDDIQDIKISLSRIEERTTSIIERFNRLEGWLRSTSEKKKTE